MKTLLTAAIVSLALCICLLSPGFAQNANDIWVISFAPDQGAEMVLAQTLQGLSGRKRPMLMLDNGAMSAVILSSFKRRV